MPADVLLVAVLVLVAYMAGYLIGRAESDRRWRWRLRFDRMGEQMQQAYLDRPGNPKMN